MPAAGYYVLTVSDVCPDVPCQHGLILTAGESITHMQQQRHHMTFLRSLHCVPKKRDHIFDDKLK